MYDKAGMFGGGRRRETRVSGTAVAPLKTSQPHIRPEESTPEVAWTGVFRGFSGYAKANREIVLRAANTLRVSTTHAIDPRDHDEYQLQRIDLHGRVGVSKDAPRVRFFGPSKEPENKHSILYTMMETGSVHPEMVALIDQNYNEVWTPTRWNADAFRRGGVKAPIRVMPLGVNPHVYRPGSGSGVPPCELLTTARACEVEQPEGFVFVYCFLPSFRKGLDVLLPAFERAFGNDPDVSLVLAVTHWQKPMLDPDIARTRESGYRSRVHVLSGLMSEQAMADLYRSCDAYVCASRGEGWNLPMCEAAACGLPVIAPRNTAHEELLDESTGYLFDTEGEAPWPGAQSVSPWYEGQTFSVLGERSVEHLATLLKKVREDRTDVAERAGRFCDQVRSKHTWDRAAAHVVERILEIKT